MDRYIKYFGISLGLFSYYAGEFSIYLWLSSAVLLTLFVRRIPSWLLGYISILTFYFALRILLESNAVEETLRDMRFFWGFVVFMPFFISEQRQSVSCANEYESLFRFLTNLFIVLLLAEFLTSNFLSMEWPNRSHEISIDLETSSLARAYGFGGNATVTSTLLIALGALLYRGKPLRDIATLGLAASGTGLVVFILKSGLMLGIRYLLMGVALFVFFYITVWSSALESGLLDVYGALGKFSLDYIGFLIEAKYDQYQSAMTETNGLQLAFGQTFIDPSLRTGDFQLLDFLTFNGLFGVGMLLLIVAKCANKNNRVPLFLVLIATIHYQIIYSIPGQIIFAWLLTVGMRAPQRPNKSTEPAALD